MRGVQRTIVRSFVRWLYAEGYRIQRPTGHVLSEEKALNLYGQRDE